VNYISKVNKAEGSDFRKRTGKDMRDERQKRIMGNKLNWRNNMQNTHIAFSKGGNLRKTGRHRGALRDCGMWRGVLRYDRAQSYSAHPKAGRN
jgi:hypothetical protein